MTLPRLPVAQPADVPALNAAAQNCSGGNPCALCERRVLESRHTIHRCKEPGCICHDGWRLAAEEWDALVRCGRKQVPAGLAQ